MKTAANIALSVALGIVVADANKESYDEMVWTGRFDALFCFGTTFYLSIAALPIGLVVALPASQQSIGEVDFSHGSRQS